MTDYQKRNPMLKSLKTVVLATIVILGLSTGTKAQQMGVSFSYFVPKNGYFSTPISPFSIRGIGVDLNRYVAIETGGSLYRMTGLNVKDLPFESRDPLLGPMFSAMVPLELVLQFIGQDVEFRVKGGLFGFWNFSTKINYGNFDRAIREYEGWTVANSDLRFKNNPGWGYQFGAEAVIYMNQQFGITLGANYYIGDAKLDMEGTYTGGTDGNLETKTADFSNAKVDFTGFELVLGAVFSTR